MKDDYTLVVGNPKHRRKKYRFTKARRAALKKAQRALRKKLRPRRIRRRKPRRRNEMDFAASARFREAMEKGLTYTPKRKKSRKVKKVKKERTMARKKRHISKKQRAKMTRGLRKYWRAKKAGKSRKTTRRRKGGRRRGAGRVYLRTRQTVDVPIRKRYRKSVKQMFGGRIVHRRRVRRNPAKLGGTLKTAGGVFLGFIANQVVTNAIQKYLGSKVSFLQNRIVGSALTSAALYFVPRRWLFGMKEEIVAGSIVNTGFQIVGKLPFVGGILSSLGVGGGAGPVQIAPTPQTQVAPSEFAGYNDAFNASVGGYSEPGFAGGLANNFGYDEDVWSW